jgi:hypothetical protein
MSTISLKQLPAELDKIKAKYAPRDFGPALQEVDAYLIGRVEESFRERETPDGRRWAGQATLVQSGGLFIAATAPGEITEGGTLKRKTRHKLSHILQGGARYPRAGGKKKARKKTRPDGAILRAAKLAKRAEKIAKAIAAGKVTTAALAALDLFKPKKKRPSRLRKPRTGKYRIPPRPFEGIADRDRGRILEIIARHATRGR